MSQWAPDSAPSTSPLTAEEKLKETHSFDSGGRGFVRTPMPWWVRGVPFFLSAVFFLSAFFAVFSPLPLLILSFRATRKWVFLACATNLALVCWAAGGVSAAVYGVFAAVLALTFAGMLKIQKSVELAGVASLFMMAVMGFLVALGYSKFYHASLIGDLREQVASTFDYIAQSNPHIFSGDVEEWKGSVMVELPSVIAVFSLILVWANAVLLLAINPGRIRESLGLDSGFSRQWKAPEFLIWPTIVSGFLLLIDLGKTSQVGVNVFKFLMAIYAIQGLSIISFFLDLWKVRGVFRISAFVAVTLLAMPVLLGLGVFDLWFDFRGKFRQS